MTKSLVTRLKQVLAILAGGSVAALSTMSLWASMGQTSKWDDLCKPEANALAREGAGQKDIAASHKGLAYDKVTGMCSATFYAAKKSVYYEWQLGSDAASLGLPPGAVKGLDGRPLPGISIQTGPTMHGEPLGFYSR